MSTSIVTHEIPGIGAGVPAICRLKPVPGFRLSDASEVYPVVETESSGDGEFSFELEDNTNINPTGTFWQVEIRLPIGSRLWNIYVDGDDTLMNSLIDPLSPTGNLVISTPGPQGEEGPQGVQGIQGVQGVQGDPGPQGDPGVDGSDAPSELQLLDDVSTVGAVEGSILEWDDTALEWVDSTRLNTVETSLTTKQPLDTGLTDIAALAPPNDSFIQRKSGAWVARSMAQLKTDLALAKGDVGLPLVDNTSDASKPVSALQAAAIALKVNKAGDTLTGNLVGVAPTLDTHLATRGSMRTFVRSRGQNLVSNGFGQMRDSTGFPGGTFDSARVPAGFGSFRYTGTGVVGDEYIAVDPLEMYVMSLYAKADASTVNSGYFGVMPNDVDNFNITPRMWNFTPATVTTLTAQLNPGDTVVNVASSAGWSVGTTYEMAVWSYTSLTGFTYPVPPTAGAYTRLVSGLLGGGSTAVVGAGTITLSAAWTGPIVPVGTTVSQTVNAATYMYVAGYGVTVGTSWVKYSGHIGRMADPALGIGVGTTRFSPATVSVRIVLLTNLGGTSTPHNLGGISFGLHPRALKSPDGTWRQLLVDNAGVITAPALA